MEEIFENIFSQEEIRIVDGITSLDIKTLKTLGSVNFTTSEKDGIVTETLTFTEPTGLYNFTKVNSYNKNDKIYSTVQVINEAMAIAVSEEDYELAAILKHKKENLLFNSEN